MPPQTTEYTSTANSKQPEQVATTRFINNLDIDGLRQALIQLLLYPKSKPFIENSINEFAKFYKFPLVEK